MNVLFEAAEAKTVAYPPLISKIVFSQFKEGNSEQKYLAKHARLGHIWLPRSNSRGHSYCTACHVSVAHIWRGPYAQGQAELAQNMSRLSYIDVSKGWLVAETGWLYCQVLIGQLALVVRRAESRKKRRGSRRGLENPEMTGTTWKLTAVTHIHKKGS